MAATIPAAGQVLAESLAELARGRALHLVVGMLTTKDLAQFLAPLLPLAASLRFVPVPGEPLGPRSRGLGRHGAPPAGRPGRQLPACGRRRPIVAAETPALRHTDLRLALSRRRRAARASLKFSREPPCLLCWSVYIRVAAAGPVGWAGRVCRLCWPGAAVFFDIVGCCVRGCSGGGEAVVWASSGGSRGVSGIAGGPGFDLLCQLVPG